MWPFKDRGSHNFSDGVMEMLYWLVACAFGAGVLFCGVAWLIISFIRWAAK